MKYRVLFVAVLAFMIQGCGEDKFFSDNCAVNEYLCSGTEEAPSFPLYLCRLIDKKHNVTRWERMSDWEINNRCGMTSSCSDCKDKLINNKEVCEVGTFNCDSSGNLVECQLFDSEKNLAIWVLSDVCTGDCDKCLEQIDKNCSVGDFRCSNDGELQECQRLNGSKELTKWEKSDICTMNCDACVNALHEGCPHGEIQCDADRTFICEVSGQNGSVDVWKTTDECQNACSNCDDESCKLCIDKHNAALKTCEKEDEYFSYIAQTCVAVDANYNHMHDQYENAEKAGKDCSTHSECDSDNHSEDGFCDSYIGYKCSTRCTSDAQCVDDGEFHYVCRSDGRCAPDEFVTMWKFTTDHQTTTKPKTVTIYSEDCKIEQIDWGDGDVTKKTITVCNNSNSPVNHTYSTDGTYTIRIKGKINQWSAHPFTADFDTDVEPNKVDLVEVVAFGPVGLGPHCFAGTSINHISKVDIPDSLLMNDLSYAFSFTDFNSPIEHWDLSNVRTIKGMFYHDLSFNQSLQNWDVSNVSNMGALFDGASSFDRPLGNWDVSNVTNMRRMFRGASNFNSDISKWNVSNVVSMSEMFSGASSFDQNIGNWITNNVESMGLMFKNATAFNHSLGEWNTSKVKTMVSMFENATSFNQDISKWDTSNVTNMESMFKAAKAFNKSINTNTAKQSWNVSNVTNMRLMFEDAESFNQPLNNWNTGNVLNMYRMFKNALSFNQDISSWNTGNVRYMNEMFWGTRTFDQDLSPWKTSNVIAMQHMFENSGFSHNIKNWTVSGVKCDNNGTFYLMFSLSKISFDVCEEIAKEWQKKNEYYKNVKPGNGQTALEKIKNNLGCPQK